MTNAQSSRDSNANILEKSFPQMNTHTEWLIFAMQNFVNFVLMTPAHATSTMWCKILIIETMLLQTIKSFEERETKKKSLQSDKYNLKAANNIRRQRISFGFLSFASKEYKTIYSEMRRKQNKKNIGLEVEWSGARSRAFQCQIRDTTTSPTLLIFGVLWLWLTFLKRSSGSSEH